MGRRQFDGSIAGRPRGWCHYVVLRYPDSIRQASLSLVPLDPACASPKPGALLRPQLTRIKALPGNRWHHLWHRHEPVPAIPEHTRPPHRCGGTGSRCRRCRFSTLNASRRPRHTSSNDDCQQPPPSGIAQSLLSVVRGSAEGTDRVEMPHGVGCPRSPSSPSRRSDPRRAQRLTSRGNDLLADEIAAQRTPHGARATRHSHDEYRATRSWLAYNRPATLRTGKRRETLPEVANIHYANTCTVPLRKMPAPAPIAQGRFQTNL